MSTQKCAEHKLKMAEEMKKAERKAAEEMEKAAVAAKEALEAQEKKAKETTEAAAVAAAVAAAADKTLVRADAGDDGDEMTETSVLSNDDINTDLEARPIPPNQDAFTEEHQASVGSETMVPPPARALTDTEEYVASDAEDDAKAKEEPQASVGSATVVTAQTVTPGSISSMKTIRSSGIGRCSLATCGMKIWRSLAMGTMGGVEAS